MQVTKSDIRYLRLPHTTKLRLVSFLSLFTFRRLYRCANCKCVYVNIALHGDEPWQLTTESQCSRNKYDLFSPSPQHILSTEKIVRIIFVGYLEFIDNIVLPILCKQAKPHAKWLNENFISNFIHVSVRSEYSAVWWSHSIVCQHDNIRSHRITQSTRRRRRRRRLDASLLFSTKTDFSLFFAFDFCHRFSSP